MSFDTNSGRDEKGSDIITIVTNSCVLRPSLRSSIGQSDLRPTDTFEFTLSANCRNSRLENPIFAFLMPKELEYIGEEKYIYGDIFTQTDPPQPTVRLIEDFTENGDTLVKFQFTGENSFSFRQLATIKISFKVKVRIGAYGSISSMLLLNTEISEGVITSVSNIYVDGDNIAENTNVSVNYAKSASILNDILFFAGVSSDKKIKGLLDSQYIEEPDVGRTVNGGSLEYLITVKNIGNANFNEIDVVDILPFFGDTGVVVTSKKRNSDFPVYAISEVVALVMPEREDVEFEILYSTSTDPVRFGPAFNVIGTDDNWTQQAPDDLSLLRAFRVKVKNTVLYPGQSLKIAITASIPVGVPISSVAWNSFAADVAYVNLNGETAHLLAVEPEKVGIQVVQAEQNTVSISGYSWTDNDGDGYYSGDESFVNDVAVILYDEDGNQLRYTSTLTDANAVDGRYRFDNLKPGRYFVKFFIDSKNLKFTKQIIDGENTSKPNRNSGVTDIIDLTEKTQADNINVGIMPKGKHTLEEILKINRQTRGVVRDVVKNQMLLAMKQEDVLELIEHYYK